MSDKPVLTAKQGRNRDLFADIARIYIPDGSRVLDMTYGKGGFWTPKLESKYDLVRNDLVTPADTCVDLRATGFDEKSFDAVILDPPYMHGGAKGPTQTIKASISGVYQNNNGKSPRSTTEVADLYRAGAVEAHRILKPKGILIIKCQDEIESGKQRWNHVTYLNLEGFVCEDLFILVQNGVPAMRVQYQLHARKNHSYFIVQRKRK